MLVPECIGGDAPRRLTCLRVTYFYNRTSAVVARATGVTG